MRFPDADIMTIDLMRHGEPLGGRMLRGSTDHPLSETACSSYMYFEVHHDG